MASNLANYPDYSHYTERLKSFETWPKSMRQKPTELSDAGYYYLGAGDQVKCFGCGTVKQDWGEKEEPWKGHFGCLEECPHFVRSVQNKSKTIEQNIAGGILPYDFTDVIGIQYPNERLLKSCQRIKLLDPQLIPQQSMSATVTRSDYRKSTDRLKLFDAWPKSKRQKPTELSDAGFYYLGTGDKVECIGCGTVIQDWKENEESWEAHLYCIDECPYFRQSVERKFKTEDEQRESGLLSRHSFDSIGIQYLFEQRHSSIAEDDILNHQLITQQSMTPTVARQDFCKSANRLKSFDAWPKSKRQKPTELSDAGFYYLGTVDQVECISCGTVLQDWEERGEPWEAHFNCLDECPYFRQSLERKFKTEDEQRESGGSSHESIDSIGIQYLFDEGHSSNAEDAILDHQLIPQQSMTTTVARQDYCKSANRLKSFDAWPKTKRQKPTKLSDAGFYYLGTGDQVECIGCGTVIEDWEENEKPWEAHLYCLEECPYFRQSLERKFKTEDEQHESGALSHHSIDTIGIQYLFEEGHSSIAEDDILDHQLIPQQSLTATMNKPDYRKSTNRLKSFDAWPITNRLQPTELSDAGFYYLGAGDQVECFCCGTVIQDWNEHEEPWEGHLFCLDDCPYFMQSVEKKFKIEDEHQQSDSRTNETNITNIQVETPQSEMATHENSADEAKLCKICYDNEMNATMFPCMHVMACISCATELDLCPICRNQISEVKRIYFS